MAAAAEDWTAWDEMTADGLDTVPWEPAPSRRVAEPKPESDARRRPRKR